MQRPVTQPGSEIWPAKVPQQIPDLRYSHTNPSRQQIARSVKLLVYIHTPKKRFFLPNFVLLGRREIRGPIQAPLSNVNSESTL